MVKWFSLKKSAVSKTVLIDKWHTLALYQLDNFGQIR